MTGKISSEKQSGVELTEEDLNEVVGGLMAVSSSDRGNVWREVGGEVGAAAGAIGGVVLAVTFGCL